VDQLVGHELPVLALKVLPVVPGCEVPLVAGFGEGWAELDHLATAQQLPGRCDSDVMDECQLCLEY
jgi:hypothetical protein